VQTDSGFELAQWMCQIHNVVNRRYGQSYSLACGSAPLSCGLILAVDNYVLMTYRKVWKCAM
jgi:hypothetical protein